ncbi:MAG: EamA family transporter [Mesorhizobium sp.]
MQPRHLLLAMAIVVIWGLNFAVIKLGLQQVSPIALGVMRFVLAVVPWIFFVRRPTVPLWEIALYGLLIFAMQFGFLFTGMTLGVSAGLSSLILQTQVFFTIGISMVALGERPTGWQLVGALVAFSGILVILSQGRSGADVTVPGLALLIAAAFSWGAGNVVAKHILQKSDSNELLGLVIWGSLFAIPPLMLTELLLEPGGLMLSISHLDWVSVGSIAYIVYLSTLFGFGVWAYLMSIYPVSTVAPFTLLVPIFGFIGSAIVFGEAIEGWKIAASGLVIAGLAINLFGPRLFRRSA